MKIPINKAKKLVTDVIEAQGFSNKESNLIADNFIQAELAGKKSHGFSKVIWFAESRERLGIEVNDKKAEVLKESPVSLLINGNNKPGFYVMSYSIEKALKKVSKTGLLAVGLTNTKPTTGFMGGYASQVVDAGYIFIAFTNSTGRVIPHGSIKKMWGTNPITVAIPTGDVPVVLDMSTSKITVGDLLSALRNEDNIPNNTGINGKGDISTNPKTVWEEGGLLPLAGHKGSGLVFIGELLAGALTGSRVGYSVPGGWGTFYLIIDPTLFREKDDFYKDVQTAINELKTSPKAKGFSEIYYPGERSQKIRKENLRKQELEIDKNVHDRLLELSRK